MAKDDLVRNEVKRRACAGAKYPKQPWPPGVAQRIAEGEAEMIQEWLNRRVTDPPWRDAKDAE